MAREEVTGPSALGFLGGGTFGAEGPVALDARAVARLVELANITSVAVARLVLRSRDVARLQPSHASRSGSGSRAWVCSRAAWLTTSTTC